jgi:lipoprotein NlpI
MFALCLTWSVTNSVGCAQVVEDEARNREAQTLLRSGAEALSSAKFEEAKKYATKVAELLPKNSRVQQRAAELLYLSGYASESIPVFDKANELDPSLLAKNWQLGIALATNGDFKRGAELFKSHREVNPDDVENSAWYYLCVAKSEGLEKAKSSVIPSRGDPRPPMMNVLKMLDGKETPEQVLEAAEKAGSNEEERNLARFYANLYVGLYFDSVDRKEDAVKYLKRSREFGIDGYMADTARVYLRTRFKESKDSKDSDSNRQP